VSGSQGSMPCSLRAFGSLTSWIKVAHTREGVAARGRTAARNRAALIRSAFMVKSDSLVPHLASPVPTRAVEPR
jgi:hypothetical protein